MLRQAIKRQVLAAIFKDPQSRKVWSSNPYILRHFEPRCVALVEKNHEFTRIALEKLEKIRCITSLKKLFHGVLFKSNAPRCQIFSSFPLSSHEPPVVEDETVLIAVRKRSSPEVELEFACQPHAVRKIQMADFFGGEGKRSPIL